MEQTADSAVLAPLQVRELGVQTYDDLTRTPSSMDLKDPDNVQTTVEYDARTGYYVVHTRIGDVDITTPYLLSEDEYRS